MEGNDPHESHGQVCEGDRACVGVRSNYCVLGDCLLSLSLCRRGSRDSLKVRPSSVLMLCGCISSSVASLMSRSIYPVLAERSFVSCSIGNVVMVNAVFCYCWFVGLGQSYMSVVLFDSDLHGSTALSNISPATFTWVPVCT